jgi:hypothetical protein
MNPWRQVYKHRCVHVCGVLLWCGAIAMAQVDTGMIAGTVRDNSGAVIAASRMVQKLDLLESNDGRGMSALFREISPNRT